MHRGGVWLKGRRVERLTLLFTFPDRTFPHDSRSSANHSDSPAGALKDICIDAWSLLQGAEVESAAAQFSSCKPTWPERALAAGFWAKRRVLEPQ